MAKAGFRSFPGLRIEVESGCDGRASDVATGDAR